jgi:hypothetical protein
MVILSQEAQQAGRTLQFQDTENQSSDSISKIQTLVSEISFLKCQAAFSDVEECRKMVETMFCDPNERHTNQLTKAILSDEAQQAVRTSQFQDTEKQPSDFNRKDSNPNSEIRFL